jgi:hypothetical protein
MEADYRKVHGHCNVPRKYSENIQLGAWVGFQRYQYRLHRKGKTSFMTLFRIQQLESLGFEWDSHAAAWEVRLSELADYRKIHGHYDVPKNYSENIELSVWVSTQRSNYKWHQEGKISPMTLSRIQELESLGFEWDSYDAAWQDRLTELAAYRKIHGHCNVPRNYSENIQLGAWVGTQRNQYKLHRNGNTSYMTLSRIQELESTGFEWDSRDAVWQDRLTELAAYRKIHGHCNVPRFYSENIQLGTWVSKQKTEYRLHREGNTSKMKPFRFQALKSLGFD